MEIFPDPTINSARLWRNENLKMVRIDLQTFIKDKNRLEVLLSRTLRAVSIAERDVSMMTEEESEKAYTELVRLQSGIIKQ